MMTPTFQEFKALAARFNLIPVSEETVVDRLTPVAVYEQLRQDEPYSFLLESVEGGERFGRYSFIGRKPHAVFQCQGDTITYRTGRAKRTWVSTNPLLDLKTLFSTYRPAERSGLPRFWGGAVGYWDYDTVRFFERLPSDKPDLLNLPTGIFQISGELVVLDRFSQKAQVFNCVHLPPGKLSEKTLAQLYRQAERSIHGQIRQIHAPLKKVSPAKRASSKIALRPLNSRDACLDAVAKAKEHIVSGDIIQVVLSQRWEVREQLAPLDVYRALRMVNPSPYMYLLHFPELDIVGSSPELLVRKDHQTAETRPIAGTRRRGVNESEDAALARELLHDPKERAEHLMLVDLGRNDLGRVCESGSVKVPQLMTIEHYSHVMHLVSSVTGRLSPSANAFDLFQACFPAGTVSGAPKIRAMQIIDELEAFRRGPYAGSVGYFSFNGNMDMAITIRTLVFARGKTYLQAGAGIVADSVPTSEYREYEHKAAALVAAIQKSGELR